MNTGQKNIRQKNIGQKNAGQANASKSITKKSIKKASLFDSAFHLFTTQGFAKTSIAEIAAKAGIAKGTFYLYFEDKFDLRNKLISYESSKLLKESYAAMIAQRESGRVTGFVEEMLFICDYLLDVVSANKPLLNFISKNLGWGIFKEALETNLSSEEGDSKTVYMEIIAHSEIEIKDPEIMLFLIIELLSATAHSAVLYEQPANLETLRPYIHQTVRAIIENHMMSDEDEA